jgi:NAD(P)-dependent dehydrogenase (short-subunit alcohol dehydrogenase family)
MALVAGGGGAIGGAVATLLKEHGATVCSADLPGKSAPGGVATFECDLARPRDVEQVFARVKKEHGGLDILVHAAGIVRDGSLWKLTDEDWSQVLKVNLDSAFYVLRGAAPLLRERGRGAVVLVSSINGERAKAGQANYAASKAGLNALARTAAREMGRFGVRVNVVAPGWTETPMTAGLSEELRQRALGETALGRLARPEDVARVALFLCSDMSRHVTGQVIRVDGGQLMA